MDEHSPTADQVRTVCRGPRLVLVVAASIVGLAALGWWPLARLLAPDARLRVLDPGNVMPAPPPLLPEGRVERPATPATPGPGKGSWPCFRGGRGDGIVDDGVRLARSWPEGGPRLLWQRKMGSSAVVGREIGHNGCAVLGGCVYSQDYDLKDKRDLVRALSLADGQDLWAFSYPVDVKPVHGVTRNTVAVSERFVVTIGPFCHLYVLDRSSGAMVWGRDMGGDWGSQWPGWFSAQSPLIDGDRLIVAPSGSQKRRGDQPWPLLLALDLATGKELWRSPNLRDWKMTHVSIATMVLAGRTTYIYCGHKGVAGIDAGTGAVVWDTQDWQVPTAAVATPVPLSEDRVFLCGGYGAGAMMAQLVQDQGRWTVRELYRLDSAKSRDGRAVFGSEQHTPILFKGFIYGIRSNGELVCLDPASGKDRWTSGRDHSFGLGPYSIADGLLFAVNDADGRIEMSEPGPGGYRLLASAKVTPGDKVYAPITIVEGLMLVRDQEQLCCYDLREGGR